VFGGSFALMDLPRRREHCKEGKLDIVTLL